MIAPIDLAPTLATPDRPLAERAMAAALVVAQRLAPIGVAEQAAAVAMSQSHFPSLSVWRPMSLAHGNAGLVLLFGYLDRIAPDAGWAHVAHAHLAAAARHAEAEGKPPIGLFDGLAGLGFAATWASRGGQRYGRLLQSIDDALAPRAIAAAAALDAPDRPVGMGDFDVIGGLAGVGAYLLGRTTSPPAAAALQAVLGALTRLVAGDDGGCPRWSTAPELLYDDAMRERYPAGYLNCGLAHGLPGPLAVLALATLAGVEVPGQRDAVRAGAEWLLDHTLDDDWGRNWPTAVPLVETDAPDGRRRVPAAAADAPDGPSRAAWCYGTPGVAAALRLAGDALGERRYIDAAVDAMTAVHRRPVDARQIDSPTICHGVAGLLQATLRIERATGGPHRPASADALVAQILAAFDPDHPLGFRDLEYADHAVDQPGLLDGAPGVALALLAYATDVPPGWDRAFLYA